MSPLNTVTGHRCLLILERLQHGIVQLQPTTKDFCKYRNQILTEEQNKLDSQKLLDHEAYLLQEQDSLEKYMIKVKDNEKKKEFVDIQSKLITTQNSLKNMTRQLNKMLFESEAVLENGMKLQNVFGWLKQKLERNDVEASLLGQELLTKSITTAEKSQELMKIHDKLQNEIITLKKRHNQVVLKKAEIEAISEATVEMEKDFKQKKTEWSNRKKAQLIQMKDTKLKQFNVTEETMKEKLRKCTSDCLSKTDIHFILRNLQIFGPVETRKDIEGEKNNHSEFLSQYQEQISNTNLLLEQEKSKWQHRSQELRRQLDDLIRQREDNLKTVLELRLTWQQYENKKKATEEEQIHLKAKEIEMDREHNAAMILQNKIRVLYVSKLNKKKTNKVKKK